MKQLVGSLCKRHAVAPYDAPTACKRTVSGSLSLPCSGCFPPFPHGTGPLSVFRLYLALRDGPRGFRQDSTCPALLRWLSSRDRSCLYGPFTLCGPTFQTVPVRRHTSLTAPTTPAPPRRHRFGLFPFRSPLLRESILFFLFLGVLRCFSSPRSPSLSGVYSLQLYGLPHSDISGSSPVCGSPELFAAYHVLLRHRKPRHPPFALILFLC